MKTIPADRPPRAPAAATPTPAALVSLALHAAALAAVLLIVTRPLPPPAHEPAFDYVAEAGLAERAAGAEGGPNAAALTNPPAPDAPAETPDPPQPPAPPAAPDSSTELALAPPAPASASQPLPAAAPPTPAPPAPPQQAPPPDPVSTPIPPAPARPAPPAPASPRERMPEPAPAMPTPLPAPTADTPAELAAAPTAAPPAAPDAPRDLARPEQPPIADPELAAAPPPAPDPPRDSAPAERPALATPAPPAPAPEPTVAQSPQPAPRPPAEARRAAPPPRTAAREGRRAPAAEPAAPLGGGRELLTLPGGGQLGNARASTAPAPPGPSRNANLADRTCFERNKRYPPDLEERGISGTVRVMISVTETGRVETVSILASSGTPALDAAARAAVLACAYVPALRDGQPVPSILTTNFHYRPEEARRPW